MEDRRPEVLVVSIVFFVIASIFVALRFVSRVFIVKKVGLHDWLMLLAWVCHVFCPATYPCTITWNPIARMCSSVGEKTETMNLHVDVTQIIDFGFSFSLFYATSKGLGLHDDDIDLNARYSLTRANYAFTVLYVSCQPSTRRI
jgi:hypothetical protein